MLTILIGFLTLVNYCGVKSGAIISNVFTVAKLVPLCAFAIAGGVSLLQAHNAFPVTSVSASVPVRNWFDAVLVLVFVYGGFEGAVVPMAEARDPRGDVPFALYVALATTAVLY